MIYEDHTKARAALKILSVEGIMLDVSARCIIRIKRINPEAVIPQYLYPGDSGADVRALDCFVLQPYERKVVPTGLCAEIPVGFELQIRPRSGLALTHGVTVLNAPGTIDSGYRGEIRVLLVNLSPEPYMVKNGQRIAQFVLAPVIQAEFKEVDELSKSERGTGGFGSTQDSAEG